MRTIAKSVAIVYAGFWTIFALLSGAVAGNVLANWPNVLPWLLVWLAIGVAWRWPKTGGWLFLVLAAASVFFFQTFENLFAFLLVSAPLIVVGILFLRRA